MLPYEIYTNDLEWMVSSDKILRKNVHGIYPSDMMPTLDFSKGFGLIANTDESDRPGQHWLAVFIPNKGPPEFFDPLAFPPIHYVDHFENFLVNRGPQYKFNTQKVQSDESTQCGLFCIYYLYFRSRNVSFEDILSSFSHRLSENDKKLLTFFHNHFSSNKKA